MARPKGPRKLYRYTDEFKLKAVKLTELPGVRVQDVAEALDVHPWMLSRWRTAATRGAFSRAKKVSLEVAEQQEVKELGKVKRELALLREEHELLKKAIRFCSAQRTRSSRS
jgi:transposase